MLTDKKKSLIVLHGLPERASLTLLKKKGKKVCVLEGRPYLTGARKTTRALLKQKISPTVIADNMAGFLFYKNLVKEAWITYHYCDNHGLLCDVGSMILAVLAKHHKIPVYAVASKEKVRMVGAQKDMTMFNGVRIAPGGVKAYVPLVEWIPKTYIAKVYQ